MPDWVQHHPTTPMTTPDGQSIEIDTGIAPFVQQLWRLGVTTCLACQDAGEATLHGGTCTRPADRERLAAANAGRAWVMIAADQGERLLEAVRPLSGSGWSLHAPSDMDPEVWVSVSFPAEHIAAAAELLSEADALGQ